MIYTYIYVYVWLSMSDFVCVSEFFFYVCVCVCVCVCVDEKKNPRCACGIKLTKCTSFESHEFHFLCSIYDRCFSFHVSISAEFRDWASALPQLFKLLIV